MSRFTILLVFFLLNALIIPAGARSQSYLILDKAPDVEHREETGAPLPDSFPPSLRWRAVTLNPIVKNQDEVKKGDALVLNLFPDTWYTAEIERVEKNVQGVITVSGRIRDYQAAHIIITTAEKNTFVEIRIPQKNSIYRIQSRPGESLSYLLELDVGNMDYKESAPPLTPPDNLRIK